MLLNYFKKKPKYFLYSLIVLVLIIFAVWFVANKESKDQAPTNISLPIAQGTQSYDIITNSARKFKITEIIFDPLDVKEGAVQTVRVFVKDTEDTPITSEDIVEGTAFTDQKSTPFTFLLKEVGGDETGTITTWEGSWLCQDTYNYLYKISITAQNSSGEKHSVDLSFR
jgi:hypothetical protein